MTKEIKIPVDSLLKGGKKPQDDTMIMGGGDTGERAEFEAKLERADEQLKASSSESDPVHHANLLLDKVNSLLGLGRKKHIWNDAKTAFEIFIENQCWEKAAEACEVMYMSEEEASIKALMHGVWLAVSFPVDPELTISLLDHIVDETPPNADGAAIAAATAHYIVGLRAKDADFENLSFLTAGLLGKVAKDHSNVQTQEEMDEWMERMQLNDPQSFLPKLGLVLNAVVEEGQWWFDRDKLREYFPQ